MTLDDCSCCIQIIDPERNKRWTGIFKDDWIPVAGLARAYGEFPNDKSGPYFALAVYKLTQSQKLLVAKRASEFFGINFDDVLNDLERPNVVIPILKENTVLVICEKHTRMLI